MTKIRQIRILSNITVIATLRRHMRARQLHLSISYAVMHIHRDGLSQHLERKSVF